MSRPQIDDPQGVQDSRATAILRSMKSIIDFITGRSKGKIKTLGEDVNWTGVVAKVNEIINRLQEDESYGKQTIGGIPMQVNIDQTTAGFETLNVEDIPYPLQVARGLVTGVAAVHEFGHPFNGVQTTATDFWGRADSAATQQIWVAPTTARTHAIVSSSASDDGDPVGVGARTVEICGLTSWTTAEVQETVTLNGTDAVNTANTYVCIHGMKVLTCGTTGVNVGTITATAATDNTITAVILPGMGRGLMAILGIPSIQTLYLTGYGASMNDATAVTRVDLHLMINSSPNVSPLNVRFRTEWEMQLQNSGSSSLEMAFNPYKEIPGPAIIKIQASSNAADTDVCGYFNGYLVTN